MRTSMSVQGVIDAWIDGEDYITLIDFKTDKKPEDMTAALKNATMGTAVIL